MRGLWAGEERLAPIADRRRARRSRTAATSSTSTPPTSRALDTLPGIGEVLAEPHRGLPRGARAVRLPWRRSTTWRASAEGTLAPIRRFLIGRAVSGAEELRPVEHAARLLARRRRCAEKPGAQYVGAVPVRAHPGGHHAVGAVVALGDVLAAGRGGDGGPAAAVRPGVAERFLRVSRARTGGGALELRVHAQRRQGRALCALHVRLADDLAGEGGVRCCPSAPASGVGAAVGLWVGRGVGTAVGTSVGICRRRGRRGRAVTGGMGVDDFGRFLLLPPAGGGSCLAGFATRTQPSAAAQLRGVAARRLRVPGRARRSCRPSPPTSGDQHRPAVAVDGQRRLRAGAARPAHGEAPVFPGAPPAPAALSAGAASAGSKSSRHAERSFHGMSHLLRHRIEICCKVKL